MKKNKIQKIMYSRCPGCKKYGIFAFNKIGHRYNRNIECKYCKKKYSVNIALSIAMKIAIPVLIGIIGLLINTYVVYVPLLMWGIIILIVWGVFEYFAPLEERNDF